MSKEIEDDIKSWDDLISSKVWGAITSNITGKFGTGGLSLDVFREEWKLTATYLSSSFYFTLIERIEGGE